MGKVLPKQVQKQIDEADRIASEMEAAQSGGTPELQVVGDEPPAPTDNTDPTLTPQDKNLSFEAPQPEADALDTPIVAPAEPVVATELGEPDNWEHKYKTLQGMFNSEKQNVLNLTTQVESMRNTLAGLSAAREAQVVDEPVAAAAKSALTEDEIKDYGPDLIDVMKRAAVEAVQGELSELRRENADLKAVVGSVGHTQEVTAKDKLYAGLVAAVPNWRQVNNHPDFLAWLNEKDVYAGVARGQMLTRAFGANDTDRVIQFFKGFLSENAALQPAAVADTSTVEVPRPTPKVDLASLASPGQGSGGGADNINETGHLWKESEIGAFYEDCRKGVFKGRDAEKQATEQEIQNALTQGRILVGQ